MINTVGIWVSNTVGAGNPNSENQTPSKIKTFLAFESYARVAQIPTIQNQNIKMAAKLVLDDGFTRKNLRRHNGIYSVYYYWHVSGLYNY